MEQLQHEDFYDASQRHNKSFGTVDYYKRKWQVLRGYSQERFQLYDVALKMFAVCQIKGIPLIMENPWHPVNFTNHFWFARPAVIDKDRTRRGDYFKKPTVYFYLNCKPTYGQSYQQTPKNKLKTITSGSGSAKTARKYKQLLTEDEYKLRFKFHTSKDGVCDTERSLISPDYARNFICDFILGKEQHNSQLKLF